MPPQRPPFSNEYSQGSQTSATQEIEVRAPVGFTISTQRAGTASVSVEHRRYGTGKPRRVVIRGKISCD